MQFLVSIQLPLLDSYLGHITSLLDVFENRSSAFARAVPGALALGGKSEASVNVNARGMASGVESLRRLCEALLSAAHIESAIESWAEDLVCVIGEEPDSKSLIDNLYLSPSWSCGVISIITLPSALMQKPIPSSLLQDMRPLKCLMTPSSKSSSINTQLS